MVLVYLAVGMQTNENIPIFITLYKYQIQIDQGPQYAKPDMLIKQDKVRKSFELTGTGENFLNRNPMAQAL